MAFNYASGTHRYMVVTTASVQLGDGIAPVEGDSIFTRAYVTYVLGGGGAGQSVGGAVDSVFVTSRRSPAASQAVTTSVPFSGTLGSGGVLLAANAAAPARCTAASTDALLAVARDLLVALPPSVAEGAVWRDSTATTTCRGNVPTTVSTVHEYQVSAVADTAGARVVTINRTSRSTIVGQAGDTTTVATTATAPIMLSGTGTAQGRFTFDVAAGRYTGGDVTSAADLRVTAGGRTQQLTQRGVTRVSLLQPAP